MTTTMRKLGMYLTTDDMRALLYRTCDRVMLSSSGVWAVRRSWCGEDEHGRWSYTKSAPGAGDPVATAKRKALAESLQADIERLLPGIVVVTPQGTFPREWPVQSFTEFSFLVPNA